MRSPSPALTPDKQHKAMALWRAASKQSTAPGTSHPSAMRALGTRRVFVGVSRDSAEGPGANGTGLFHIPTKGDELCDCPCK